MRRCVGAYAPESEREEGIAVSPPDDDRPISDRRKEPCVDDDSRCSSTSSTSSSSIGRNSSSGAGSRSSDGEDGGEPEVQSSYKGPLDAMDSLEQSLPIRKGISKFYSGKSKSFTSLSDAAAAKDLTKPEDPYNRKRKNLLLMSNIWQRNHHIGQSLRSSGSGISKRQANSCRCLVTLADTMSSSEKEVANGGDEKLRQQLPPLPPGGMSSSRAGNHGSNTSPPQWSLASRSFSLVDLQGLTSSVCCPEKQNNAVH
ncbi:protein OXIDATIVE STRESS 3 LIKE 2-like [Nymphaea colorata]|nr:protein OXIDATIVE STRESS 3 LIKE 2-like [Nymphaea colorata]XP_031496452.1 protein OXIDATIVE STRESS 3 LIKE 2-like [Nymphaea colorata]